jgi:predicted regulator of Ras-like GTPase activity (Roadblock/LC7/MglB family)
MERVALIIDNDITMRARISHDLNVANTRYRVVEVGSIEAAQFLVEQEQYAIAIIGFDGEQGLMFAQQLRFLKSDLPILLLRSSGLADPQAAQLRQSGIYIVPPTLRGLTFHALVEKLVASRIPKSAKPATGTLPALVSASHTPAPTNNVANGSAHRKEIQSAKPADEATIRLGTMQAQITPNPQIVLSPDQHEELRHILSQITQQANIHCALLADLGGQELSTWTQWTIQDLPSVAALAAGDIMAAIEINRMLGGERTCNIIIQEYDDQIVLIGRVGESLLLLLATGRDVPLGWARLALKNATTRILAVVGSAAQVPPPAAVSDDFAAQFSAQLDRVW